MVETIDTTVLRHGAVAGYYEANNRYMADNEELGERATIFFSIACKIDATIITVSRSMKNSQ